MPKQNNCDDLKVDSCVDEMDNLLLEETPTTFLLDATLSML